MKKYLLLIGLLALCPTLVFANSATVDVTSNKTNILKGDSVDVSININSDTPIGYYEYTLDYDSNKLELVKGSAYIVNRPNNNITKKVTKAFQFKVLKTSNAKVAIKSYDFYSTSNQKITAKVNPLTLRAGNSTSNSDNNYLSNLEVENQTITPKFEKEVTKYRLRLDNKTKEINIIATPMDKNAIVTGDGNQNIDPKDTEFKITVTSAKGNKRVYTIVLDKNEKAIDVTIDGKKYTIVSDLATIDIPSGYNKKELTINGQKVNGLYNKMIDYTLVALKDESGNIELFIYDEQNQSYEPYKEIKSKITFIPLETSEIFMNLEKYHITINGYDLNCYKTESASNFSYIYGMNTENGQKGWYVYDKKENTIQRFNEDLDNFYKEKDDNSQILIYILLGSTLLFGLLTIYLAIRSNKRK